jgi:hypothetical protein
MGEGIAEGAKVDGAKVGKVDYISGMTDELDDPRPLGCVPGGFIDTRNLDEYLRRQQTGLWFWSDDMVSYYESQMKWEETRAEIIAGLPPEMRKALGYE